MRIPKIYLETSVFNFFFTDDAPDKTADTISLFEEIRNGMYQPFTSVHVIEEIDNASDEKKRKMYGLISDHGVTILQKDDEAIRLADEYVKEGIIPVKYGTDALHIASATVNDLDVIVSWNFRHIVKRKTVIMTESVNLRNGYKKIGIYSPTEVIENG
ncbi:MAG: hypothetical protein LBE47_02985 [Methanomassiliicoccaceae archaeon]|jgi:rRNA-processing protein FCF1|nr:hypothetical protein [Methanomassiliicoccaceae archaeon]